MPDLPHITAYDILEDPDWARLALRVNDHIRHGWQPYGPLGHVFYDLAPTFQQPIVRYAHVPIPVSKPPT